MKANDLEAGSLSKSSVAYTRPAATVLKSGGVKDFLTLYRLPLFFTVAIALVFTIGLPTYKYLRAGKARDFSNALYKAESSLKKEEALKLVIENYRGLPAHRLAYVHLADLYTGRKQDKEALAVLDDGLKGEDVDIVSTGIALKKAGLLIKAGQYPKTPEDFSTLTKKVLPGFRARFLIYVAEALLGAKQTDTARLFLQSARQEIDAGLSLADSTGIDPTQERVIEDLELMLDLGVFR